MKRVLLIALSVALCACHVSQSRISGKIVGTNSSTLYIEHNSPSGLSSLDSTAIDPNGNFSIRLKGVTSSPELYHLIVGSERIPLFIKSGDRITINSIGSLVNTYEVSGSEDCQLLRSFYRDYVANIAQLDKLATRFSSTQGAEREQAMADYSDLFKRIKREQLRFIVENKQSPVAVYALYQRLPGDAYLHNAESDAVYYRTVVEALRESLPESAYIERLEQEIKQMESRNQLLSNIRQTGYPDLELPDMYGKKQRLSSLEGKVILLDFWSAELGNGNLRNTELKELYENYHSKGFEIYQVGIDTNKALWINSIQEQRLPWISVSDLSGTQSIAVRLYVVEKIPSSFLIDSEGNIAGRDLNLQQLEAKLKQLL